MLKRYRYVYEDVDRHGNPRLYVWRGKGHRKVRLRAGLDAPGFDTEYRAALARSSAEAPAPTNDRLKPAVADTYRWLCTEYLSSAEFKQLNPRTQRVRRSILQYTFDEKIAPDAAVIFADVPVRELTPEAIHVLRDRKAHVPESANARLKAVRQVFGWALARRLKGVTFNPARDVPFFRGKGTGWHSWTVEEIEQFEARHPVGSKARLALALLVYTGQRRSDIVRLGRQHVRNGWLHFVQAKNAGRKPVTVDIPVLPTLQAILDQSPVGDLSFLVTQFGRPSPPTALATGSAGAATRQGCRIAARTACARRARQSPRKTAPLKLSSMRSSVGPHRSRRRTTRKLRAGTSSPVMG